ncbi:hypothetical protein V6N13_008886 [Hibiscus sabdariffa]|uniref:Uncharacterized protein n=2 Tax=Hibiscus sabdariffa TaxID=183260 RepID=A0ABR2NQS0_9ROSI
MVLAFNLWFGYLSVTTDPELLSTSQSENSSTEPLYQAHPLDPVKVFPLKILVCPSSDSVANDDRVGLQFLLKLTSQEFFEYKRLLWRTPCD